MTPLSAIRLVFAQVLTLLGLPPLPDSWAESDVKGTYRRLILVTHPDRGGDPALFRQVQEAWDTWKTHDPDSAEEGPSAEGPPQDVGPEAPAPNDSESDNVKNRIRGSAFLLTWVNSAFVGLEWVDSVWQSLISLAKDRCVKWSVTIEQCQRSSKYHAHAYIELSHPVDSSVQYFREAWTWQNQCPDLQVTHALGRSARVARDQGHFYVICNKIGTVRVEANYMPWRDTGSYCIGNYAVQPKWLDQLMLAVKITREQYEEYSVKCTVGLQLMRKSQRGNSQSPIIRN
jgi:hypothetical protein